MRKLFITAVLIFPVIISLAQDLVSKIPAKANIIGTINTGKLTQLMTVEEWSNSSFGKKMLEMSAGKSGKEVKSFNDLGLSLNSNMYYFHTENDSVHFNYILAPIADLSKFDALFNDRPIVKLANNTRMMADEDSSSFLMWNNQQVLYAKGSLKEGYFRDYEVAARHGLYTPYASDTVAYALPPVVDSVMLESIEQAQEEPVPPPPPPAKKKTKTTKGKTSTPKSKTTKKTKVKEPEPEIEEVAPAEYDTYMKVDTVAPNPYPSYDYEKEILIKKRIAAACTQEAIKTLFNNNPDTSITTNPQYVQSRDNNAAATIWVDRPMELYYSMLTGYYMFGPGMGNNVFNRASNSVYKNFTAKLFTEEKQIRITSAAEVTDDMIATQQKIFDRKLNKKILNYINTDSLLGYLSWSIDTKAYLEAFPKLLENTYGNMGLGLSSDEYSVLSEFLTFLIDEEAISKLIKGDGLVLFNGLYEQQNTYTDYEYDDNYNSKPVEKTKTDTLPRFIFLFSSDENNFERKLVNYGIRKEVVKQKEGFFELAIPHSPMTLYFTNRDGLFFLTNSISDMQNISTGKFAGKISKQEKKLLLGHNYTLFINPSKIAGEIAKTEIGATESLSSTMNAFRQMGNIRAVMHPIKGNMMTGEMTMDLPADKTNSLKYIFEIFDSLMK